MNIPSNQNVLLEQKKNVPIFIKMTALTHYLRYESSVWVGLGHQDNLLKYTLND